MGLFSCFLSSIWSLQSPFCFPIWLCWVVFVVLVLHVTLCLEALVIKASLFPPQPARLWGWFSSLSHWTLIGVILSPSCVLLQWKQNVLYRLYHIAIRRWPFCFSQPLQCLFLGFCLVLLGFLGGLSVFSQRSLNCYQKSVFPQGFLYLISKYHPIMWGSSNYVSLSKPTSLSFPKGRRGLPSGLCD